MTTALGYGIPNVLLLTSHSIAEHDDLDMFTRMGVPTFSIGAYTNPQRPGDDKRPALSNAPYFAEFEALCHEQRTKHGDEPTDFVIDWAKGDLHPDIVEWADVIIVHHFPEAWIGGNWPNIADKRVVWRTCGQSDPRLERSMYRYRREGLEIVRYSPRERTVFSRTDAFAGEDAMIRFGKDPTEWAGWRGDVEVVGNITQHMAQRGDACGFWYWAEATKNLPVRPAGPGSDAIGGIGILGFEAMREYLRSIRTYLYTGTRPASYTLGLIEAMMTGVPVVSIGRGAFGCDGLLEPFGINHDDPAVARADLDFLLRDEQAALDMSVATRERAIELFALDRVMRDWREFLGIPEPFEGWMDTTPYFEEGAA
jgi:hypothetical protein